MRFLFVPFLLTLFVSCQSNNPTTESTTDVAGDQDRLLMATLYMQQSAEYRALCRQTYRWATYALEKHLQSHPEQPAIVLDLDETVLDNSPYSAWQILQKEPYGKESWMNWTALAAADTLPGVGQFLRNADSLGVAIFYVSNRRVAELDPTLANLRQFNLPQVDSSTVLLRDTTGSKVPRRATITNQGYDIVMLCGDNLNDFAAVFEDGNGAERKAAVAQHSGKWGTRWIVLPNPTYGAWDGAIIQQAYDLTAAQQDSIRKAALQSF